MAATYQPSVDDIRAIVHCEVICRGGKVSRSAAHDDTLLLRAVLPRTIEPRRGDRLRSGVAVIADGPEIGAYPYLFRQVCRNGAVLSWMLEGRRIERVEAGACPYDVEQVVDEVHALLRASMAAEVFERVVDRLHTAVNTFAHGAALLPAWHESQILPQIRDRVERDRDRTAFGLMNAITSLARDTRNPLLRWRLEELGGGVLARLPEPRPQPHAASAEQALAEQALRH